MGKKSSLALADNLSRDGVSIKLLVDGNLKTQPPIGVKCLKKVLKKTASTGLKPWMVKVSRLTAWSTG